MSFDVAAVRAQFPALAAGAAHFDGPGGSQTPQVVADAIAGALRSPLANRGTVTRAERNADDIVRAARAAMADLLGADPRGIVFGRSMTQLTFDIARTLAARLDGRRRGAGQPAGPRRQRPALGDLRRAGRGDGALDRLRPGVRRADASSTSPTSCPSAPGWSR